LKKKGFFEFGPYRFDPREKLLYREGSPVPAARKVLETLAVLIENHGQLVEKDELLRAVWPGTFVDQNNLSQNISAIRKIFSEGGFESAVETVPRRGFRLVAPVRYLEYSKHSMHRRAALGGLLALTAAGSLIWWNRTGQETVVRSLLVLPVLNVSGDPQHDYVADGMTEGLISELARMASIRVISRTSAMAFKGSRKTVPQIARELGVDAVVEGSIAYQGNRVRIRAKLIQAGDERHLWSTVDDKDFAELGVAQAQIAQGIARRLGVPFRPLTSGSVNRAAYEEYLRGRYEWNKLTLQGLEKGITHFRNAIEHDPIYAPAYSGLADSYNQLGTVFIGSRSPLETRPLAAAAARKALEIDDRLAEAHAALGYVSQYDWKWQDAEEELRRALELNPGLASARSLHANLIIARGETAEAAAEARGALDLDPLSPAIRSSVALVLTLARRGEEAIEICLKGLEISPDYPYLLLRLGFAYVSTGNFAKAIEAYEKGVVATGRSPSFLDLLGEAYALSGQREKAGQIVKELASIARKRYVSSIHRGGLYTSLAMHDWERAFAILEEGLRERANYVAYLRTVPLAHIYPEFRATPRFQGLIARLKIPG
jgi:TolB-like protein/DNA-binding winged helix-turn-helix (wHTH) protein/Flp pilus assembly protein TadD